MSISPEEVKHVAKLSRLELNSEELQRYAEQLSAILDYAKTLEQIDTTDIEPTYNPFVEGNVLRADEPQQFANQEAILDNAPQSQDNSFAVPRIL